MFMKGEVNAPESRREILNLRGFHQVRLVLPHLKIRMWREGESTKVLSMGARMIALRTREEEVNRGLRRFGLRA